jgi:release factor glutamine methyltransferase
MGVRGMRALGEILRLSVDHVRKKGGRPRREVEEWIAHVLGLRRLDLYLMFDRPLEEAELVTLRQGVSRLAAGEPLAHLLGLAPFYGRDFVVTPDVLIPRPETEVLVSVAKDYLVSQPTPGTVVDVCTGSGCVGLTLKALFPSWHVVLSDISEKALAIARQNAQRFGLDVEFLHGDLLKPFSGRTAQCVVANPPYLSSAEWKDLDRSVAAFEPRCALEAGPTGIEMYERLFSELGTSLGFRGLCAVEIGAGQGQTVLSLAQRLGIPSLVQDLAGHDRVVTVRKP